MDRSQATPVTHRLADYTPPAVMIDALDLRFDLDASDTCVVATMDIRRRDAKATGPITLQGDELELASVSVDGQLLESTRYSVDGNDLVIKGLPPRCRLQIETRIKPDQNTSLMGLYASSGNLCTQCEAEGFRRMTFYPDRPDVLTIFTCTLVGSRRDYPVLLSNGNLVDSGKIGDDRHYATWHDPWPKPSYLFALVAGKLEFVEDTFTTVGGRVVTLRVYVQAHNIDKCDHAMASLIKSMKWDEDVYGCEYDLDIYNIVAVDDFNMGAMENKSLNVFNSKYVLASPQTATDTDYQQIEGVIGHEYFHNWSGNRVTCRDWFQLSLKEGFTVFRDQEFSADTFSRGVKRIEDVNVLRTHQFREDAGPMAHPVRPDSYVEINNFYTSTVYNKGAEVVRMLHSLLGHDRFIQGTTLYFQRHDGAAVTIEEFISALEDANDVKFDQFRRWYSQAGTPRLQVSRTYDTDTRVLKLTVEQSCPDTPGQTGKQAFHMPLRVAMLGKKGKRQPLDAHGNDEVVLEVKKNTQTFEFRDMEKGTVPSLLRGFSAPVVLETDLGDRELNFLMSFDDDPFNRWEAGQKLATRVFTRMAKAVKANRTPEVPKSYVEAWTSVLEAEMDDLNFKAEALRLPSEIVLAESMSTVDPGVIHIARNHLVRTLAQEASDRLADLYDQLATTEPFHPDAASAGRRALANTCLSLLAATDATTAEALCLEQIKTANNMTDELNALTCVAHSNWSSKDRTVEAFYKRWKNEPLVMDKWLRVQATSPAPDTVERVIALTSHAAYSERNPNKVYSLIGGFTIGNPARFHAEDGSGYRFAGDYIRKLDSFNPQVAARMMSAFTPWRRYDKDRQALMRAEIEKIVAKPELSKDVFEIASKSLK